MLVKLGVQNPLRKRLLQVVEQPVLGKHLVRIATRKQLVQNFLLNSHVMILLSIIMASRTKFLTVPRSENQAADQHHEAGQKRTTSACDLPVLVFVPALMLSVFAGRGRGLR